MNNLIRLWRWITGKIDVPNYPIPFGIILLSSEATAKGIKDDQNKIIVHYFYDKFGNLTNLIIPYSKEKVYSMETIRKIPVIDKTASSEKYPVFGKVNPGEITYMTRGN